MVFSPIGGAGLCQLATPDMVAALDALRILSPSSRASKAAS
jgi:hypothetical protein